MALDILVVDDEADIQDLVAGVLEDDGYALVTVMRRLRQLPIGGHRLCSLTCF
jgi:two-component system, NtrC family, nitrogen regulation response regulator NtrX